MTEAGKVFLTGAQRIYEAVRQSKDALTNLSSRVAGELCIATSHHIGLHRLPPILKHYVNQYPDVDLNLNFMDSESALQAVEQAQIELAVITLPQQTAANIKAYHIWDDPLAVAVGSSHPLLMEHMQRTQKQSEQRSTDKKTVNGTSAQIKSHTAVKAAKSVAKPVIVDPHELSQYAAILPDKGTFTREIVDQYFSDLQINYQVKLSSNYLETIKMMVSVGLGWSVLPETMLDKNLTILTIEQFDVCRSLGIVHHASRTLSQPASKMFELVLKS